MNAAPVIRVAKIAVSATCAVACVSLIVLWALSYHYAYSLQTVTDSRQLQLWSVNGSVTFAQAEFPPNFLNTPSSLFQSEPTTDWFVRSDSVLGFGYVSNSMITTVWAPHWAVALLFAALATAPWIKWRFSLRTLLIVTTLVAVVLGAIAIAAR